MPGGQSQRGFTKYSIDLPTEKFYNDMKKEYSDLSKYNQSCETNIVHKNITDIENICKRILRYLDNNTVSSDNDSGYNVCLLLNYWIYDSLIDVLGSENTLENINSAFEVIQMMWKHPTHKLKIRNYYNKCEPNLFIFKRHDWIERRKLYEYYVDFKTIFDTANSFDTVCKEYYKKIQDNSSLYEYFEKQCQTKNDNCPDFYDKCRNYNPKLVLSDLRCHHLMEQEKAALLPLPAGSTINNPTGQELRSIAHASGTGLTLESSQIGRNIGHSVLGVAPVLLTATALYRYTPMGTWIRKLGGINTNNISDMDKFSSYTQESGDMFSEHSENYISYQPM
ncbi:PIR protein [Plasmodium ovale]|uniref:PIR protein n=1 Tax=Plasmodium ovale TaxID=36330 RepID=A0A1D3KWL4_PLAOA|nr:PIR protein [Plasmodium ovale]